MKTYSDAKEYTGGMPLWDDEGRLQAPRFKHKHVDGPLLVFSDGQLHWLTWRERFMVWVGLWDAEIIQWKRRPNLVAAFGLKRAIPRVQFYFGPDYAQFGYKVLTIAWGKQYTAYEPAKDGLLVYKHWIAVRWLPLLRFDWA